MKIFSKVFVGNKCKIYLLGIKIFCYKDKKYILRKQIKNCQSLENENYDILNIYEKNTTNIGDLMSSPSLYYPKLQNSSLSFGIKDFIFTPKIKNKLIIVGGGGLFLSYFQDEINNILKLGKDNNIIFWGCGFDNYIGKDIIDFDFSNAKLVGCRDFNKNNLLYVPCSSCLSPLFDKYKNKKSSNEIIFYLHNDYSNDVMKYIKNYPIGFNKNMKNLDEALLFLSQGEYIFTNSFHGLYWATLLGKKVAVLPWFYKNNVGFSNKFLSFKYKPIYVDKFNDFHWYKDQMTSYPNALSECREINDDFYKKVLKFIEK